MTREIAEGLLEALRPTRHHPTRSLADIPIGSPEYRQIDRVVQEIDGLAKILIGEETYFYREGSAPPRITPGHEG